MCLYNIKQKSETYIHQFPWDAAFKVNYMGYSMIVAVTEDNNHIILPNPLLSQASNQKKHPNLWWNLWCQSMLEYTIKPSYSNTLWVTVS